MILHCVEMNGELLGVVFLFRKERYDKKNYKCIDLEVKVESCMKDGMPMCTLAGDKVSGRLANNLQTHF